MLTLVETGDGSSTLFNSDIGEHYHSRHGALQESRHVFVKSGLEFFLSEHHTGAVKILEVGFGTGLNFLLSADFCSEKRIILEYTGIEAYPLSTDTILQTGYDAYISKIIWQKFIENYPEAFNNKTALNEFVQLTLAHTRLLDFSSSEQFDVLYFDAFAAVHQPEMWKHESLEHVCRLLKPGGVFVTYAITGNLKRIMKSLGFNIEKAPGAPGKREMLRAVKGSAVS